MDKIKKITIIAVLIASVVVIIRFSPDIYEGIKERQETRERLNILAQEEKCSEILDKIDSFVAESYANGNIDGGEWQNESSEREFESFWSDWRKEECDTD